MGIIVIDPNSVKKINATADTHTYGYVSSDGETLAKDAINKDKQVGKKIRWVETSMSSPQT